MTRYYSLTCYANFEEKIEGWHDSLRKALWCHAIKNPCVDPREVICAKDKGAKKRRPLNKDEKEEIARIISACPWDLTEEDVKDVIKRTLKPPWELGCAGR